MVQAKSIPLVVNLEGTLVQGDPVYEMLFICLRQRPTVLLLLPWWLLQGRTTLRRRLAEMVPPTKLTLPFHNSVLAWLREERAAGRELVLATAADSDVAHAVAAQLDLFDTVIAAESGHTPHGATITQILEARFGQQGFDYVGSGAHDLPVWRAARHAIVVAPAGAAIVRRAQALDAHATHIVVPGFSPRAAVKAMRPHQWAKNALVFVPLVAAHRFTEAALLLHAIAAFSAMGLAASAGYIANDLLDLQVDRAHPRKRRRPFASGALPVPLGVPLAAGLLLAGLAIAAAVSWALALWVLLYLALTLTYSFWLKQKVLIDVFVLSALYTHRILAGSIAAGIAPSFWLLALSVFFFLSLAMLKRCSELVDLAAAGAQSAQARGYRNEDLDTLLSLGSASGFSATFVLALYINSPEVKELYQTPELLWLCCPLLLYWLSRMWVGARRGVIDDDPLVFALRERISLLVLGLMLVLAGLGAAVDVRGLLVALH